MRPRDIMSNDETTERRISEQEKIAALLSAGESAKQKLYHTILAKIASGELPSTAELKTFGIIYEEMKSKSIPSDEDQPQEELKNPISILSYLRDHQYKISRAGVYRAVSQGKIRPKKTGHFSPKDVDKFARMYLKKLDGSTHAMADEENLAVFEDLQHQKLEAEVKKAQAQAEHWQKRNMDLDAEVETRVGQSLASRLIILKTDLRNFSHAHSPIIISLVAGDPQKTVDLITYLNDNFDIHLSRYAGDEST
jgi:hypothetical protein